MGIPKNRAGYQSRPAYCAVAGHSDLHFQVRHWREGNWTTHRVVECIRCERKEIDGVAVKQKSKSRRQVSYLLSSGSPLTGAQKSRLKGELHSGAVKVKGKRKR